MAEYTNKGPIYLTQAQYDALATKVSGQEYRIIGSAPSAFKPMKSSWTGSNLTTAQAAELILADPDVNDGDAFAGGVDWSDLSTIGLGNGEATARVGGNKTFVLFTMSSSDTAPYEWNYNTFAGVWRAYSPESVLFTEQSLFDNEKAQARTNIGAVALAPYDSSATPVDGVLYYTVES